MPQPRRRQPQPSRAERAWYLTRDIGAFTLGTFILVWQTVFEEQAQITLSLVGFACLGVAGSGVAQRFLSERFGGGGEK